MPFAHPLRATALDVFPGWRRFRRFQLRLRLIRIKEQCLPVDLAFGDTGQFGDEIDDLVLENRRANFRLGLGIVARTGRPPARGPDAGARAP